MFLIAQKIKYFILIILFGGTIFVWSVIFIQTPNNILEVHFFDVGQGDSIFIETPNSRQILIDGGPDKTVLKRLNQTMPFYDQTIDLIILTHPDTDHLTGLIEVLEYYQIGHILTSGFQKDTAAYQEWQRLIKEKEIPLTIAQAGQNIVLQDGIVLEILWPDQSLINSYSKPVNNVSVVGRLVYGDIEILLTGDIENKVENVLVKQEIQSDILKLAHHGSKTSSIQSFINKVNPAIAVISVGEDNRYNHPNETVLERLKNSIIYRTDKNGDIQILTNGILFDILTGE